MQKIQQIQGFTIGVGAHIAPDLVLGTGPDKVHVTAAGFTYKGVLIEDAGRAYRTLMAVLHGQAPDAADSLASADLDRIAREAARAIMAIDPSYQPGGFAQHKARVQEIVHAAVQPLLAWRDKELTELRTALTAAEQLLAERDAQLAAIEAEAPATFTIDKLTQLSGKPIEGDKLLDDYPKMELLQFPTFTATRAEVINAGITTLQDRTHPDFIEWRCAHAQLATAERHETDTIRDRDHCSDMADKLANAIAQHLGVHIGEHSNMNDPWQEALDWIEQQPASPVFTTYPQRNVRFTFSHPAIGDARFTPLIYETMRDLMELADKDALDHYEHANGTVVQVEALDVAPPADQDAEDALHEEQRQVVIDAMTTGTGMLEIRANDAGELSAQRIEPGTIGSYIDQPGNAAAEILGDIHASEIQGQAGIDMLKINQDGSVVIYTPYRGPERRCSPHAEDPAASDPQPEHKPVQIPGAVWPDPGKMDVQLNRRDPFVWAERIAPLDRSKLDDTDR